MEERVYKWFRKVTGQPPRKLSSNIQDDTMDTFKQVIHIQINLPEMPPQKRSGTNRGETTSDKRPLSGQVLL